MMGRRPKTSLKKIDNTLRSQVTFSKRRSGLIKKASEISTLTGVDVAVVAFSHSGRPSQFPKNRFNDILLRFVNLPVNKRNYSLKDAEYFLGELDHIENDEDKVVFVNDQTKYYERQTLVMKLELQIVEAQYRSFEPDTNAVTSLAELEWKEKFLEDALKRFMTKKETLLRDHDLSLLQQTNFHQLGVMPNCGIGSSSFGINGELNPGLIHQFGAKNLEISNGRIGSPFGVHVDELNPRFINQLSAKSVLTPNNGNQSSFGVDVEELNPQFIHQFNANESGIMKANGRLGSSLGINVGEFNPGPIHQLIPRETEITPNPGIRSSFVVDLEELNRGLIRRISTNKLLMHADPWLHPDRFRKNSFQEVINQAIALSCNDHVQENNNTYPMLNECNPSIPNLSLMNQQWAPQAPPQYQPSRQGIVDYGAEPSQQPTQQLGTMGSPSMGMVGCYNAPSYQPPPTGTFGNYGSCLNWKDGEPPMFDPEEVNWLPDSTVNHFQNLSISEPSNCTRIPSPIVQEPIHQGEGMHMDPIPQVYELNNPLVHEPIFQGEGMYMDPIPLVSELYNPLVQEPIHQGEGMNMDPIPQVYELNNPLVHEPIYQGEGMYMDPIPQVYEQINNYNSIGDANAICPPSQNLEDASNQKSTPPEQEQPAPPSTGPQPALTSSNIDDITMKDMLWEKELASWDIETIFPEEWLNSFNLEDLNL